MPKRLPCASREQAGHREGPVGAVEGGQGGDGVVAGGQLEDRALVGGPAGKGGAEEVALRVAHQAALRIGTVGAVEGGQCGKGAAAGGQLEDRALVGGPAGKGRAEEVALRVAHQAGRRIGTVGAVEGGQGANEPRAGGDHEDRALAICPAECRSEEVALRVAHEAALRIGTVGAVEGGQGADESRAGGDHEDRALVGGPAGKGGAEEVALRVAHQVGQRIGPVGAIERGQGGECVAFGGGRARHGQAERDDGDERQGSCGERSHEDSLRG